MSSANSLPPGAAFSGFRVIEQIGRGSMGTVYKVEEESTGRVRALKVRPLALDRERDMRRFEREAEAGQKIDSPYISKTLRTGSEIDTGIAWILMEYAEGVSLNALIEARGALPRVLTLSIARQIFHAVAAAHAAGIVHRDLSTNNIRVKLDEDDTPHTRVLDFGIAKSTRSRTAAWTKPGLGTPLWVAPEQHLSGYSPSPSGDVWALGLLMFYLLTGRIYWRHAQPGGMSLGDLSMEILRQPLASAHDRATELGVTEPLPQHFDAWFERAVGRDPEERYVDATEAGDALWDVFADEAPAAVKSRPKRSVPPASSGMRLSRPSAEPPPISVAAVSVQAASSETGTRPGLFVPSGRVMLLLLATLLLAGYALYRVLSAALI